MKKLTIEQRDVILEAWNRDKKGWEKFEYWLNANTKEETNDEPLPSGFHGCTISGFETEIHVTNPEEPKEEHPEITITP